MKEWSLFIVGKSFLVASECLNLNDFVKVL